MHLASRESSHEGFDRLILTLCAQPNARTLSIDRSPVFLTGGRSERLAIQLDTNRNIGYLSACNMMYNSQVVIPDMRTRTEFLRNEPTPETCAVCRVNLGSYCGCDFEQPYRDGLCNILRAAMRLPLLVRLDVRVNDLSDEDRRILHRMIRHGHSLTTLGFSASNGAVSNGGAEASRALIEAAKRATNIRSLDLHFYDGFDPLGALDGVYKTTDRVTLSGFICPRLENSIAVSIRRDIPFDGSRITSLDVTAYNFQMCADDFFHALLSNKQQQLATLFYELHHRNTDVPLEVIPCMFTAQLLDMPVQTSFTNRLKRGAGHYVYPHSSIIQKSVTDDRFRYVEFKHS